MNMEDLYEQWEKAYEGENMREYVERALIKSSFCWGEPKPRRLCAKLGENCFASIGIGDFVEQGVWVAVRLQGNLEVLSESCFDLEEAISRVEEWASDNPRAVLPSKRKTAPWRAKPASLKQKGTLDDMEILYKETITSGEASDLISRSELRKHLDEAATESQLCLIAEYTDIPLETVGRKEADKIIPKLKESWNAK